MAERPFNPEEMAARIKPLLSRLIELAGFKLTFQTLVTSGQFDRDFENPDLVVSFAGPDSELLLQNKAELLKAVEHIMLEALRIGHGQSERVLFDSHDYRLMRVEELELAARAAAERVRRTGLPYRFSPMNPRERRIIHMALRGQAGVRSESEGVGPYRQVVVHSTQPAPAAQQKSRAHRPSP